VTIGAHIDTRKGYAFKSTWYSQHGTPIVKVSNFTTDSIDTSNLVRIPDDIAAGYRKYALTQGDIVVQTVGSWPNNPASVVGKTIQVSREASGALLNQNAVRLIPDHQLDARFLYFLLRSDAYKKYIINCAQGAANQASITLDSIRNFNFNLPPLPTQQKIAAVLSAYDDLIENNTRRIKILEEMAQMIYREWFVNFRFPGHEKVKMVDSPLGKIPEGWRVAKLSSLVDTQYGYTESGSKDEVGPKYVRGTDINKNSFIRWETVPYCPIDAASHEKYKLHVGDLVVIRMADPGKVGIIEKQIDAVFASYLIRLSPRDVVVRPYFLFYLMLSDYYQGFVTGASTGTTRKSASAGVLTDLDVILPLARIQQQFETIVSAIRGMLNNLLDKNANLRTTRDLLLPKLISGEVDVSELDIATEGLVS